MLMVGWLCISFEEDIYIEKANFLIVVKYL
jgi:hypothetical protein